MKYIITEDQYRLINEKINPRTIKIAMDKLYDDIKDAEVIPYSGDMWIINRKENYWYFDLDKDGTLWWREDFFNNFFKFFSIEKDEFVPLLINMVQDILNRKADSSLGSPVSFAGVMGDIIANKAKRKKGDHNYLDGRVEDILKNRREETKISSLKEDLAVWFGTKKKPKGSKQPAGPWVNICRKDKDGKHPPCGRPEASDKGYPKCRAVGVAGKMSDSEKKSACQQKRKAEKSHSKSGTGNKPKMTHYEPKNEQLHPIIRRSIRESL
jgi:hypothetical protein